MRKEIVSVLCALGLMAAASSAALADHHAEEGSETDYAAKGILLGVGGLYAVDLFDDNGADTDGSGGYLVRLGYRFHPNFAIEAQAEHYIEFPTNPGEIEAWSAALNGKGYLMTGRWQPYGVLGVGYLGFNQSRGTPANGPRLEGQGAYMMRFGMGMDAYVIDDHWIIAPEVAYVLPFDDGGAADLRFLTVSLNITYKFTE